MLHAFGLQAPPPSPQWRVRVTRVRDSEQLTRLGAITAWRVHGAAAGFNVSRVVVVSQADDEGRLSVNDTITPTPGAIGASRGAGSPFVFTQTDLAGRLNNWGCGSPEVVRGCMPVLS